MFTVSPVAAVACADAERSVSPEYVAVIVYGVALAVNAALAMEQVPVLVTATEAMHEALPTLMVTFSAAGRLSPFAVLTVTLKTADASALYVTLVGLTDTVAVVVSLVTVSPVGAVAVAEAERSVSPP